MPRTPTSRPSPIRRLAFASLWAFAALAAPHVQAAGKCGISAMTIPVTVTGSRAIAHVQIDGTDVPLMVDSGSFSSFLTEAAAERLHLHTHPAPPEMRVFGVVGKVDTRVTTVQQLKLQDGSLGDVEFIVGGNEVGAGAWGVLGRNLLGSRDMEFDLAHGVIRIVVPGSGCGKTNLAYWAAADTPVSVSDLYNEDEGATPEIMIGVKVNGKDVHAVLDTGAPVTVVSRAIALRAGLTDADMKPAGHAYGMGGGEVSQWTGHFDTVELGAERIRNNTLAIADYDDRTDMLLGLDFFLAHHVYVARSQGRLYFTYNGGPIFLLNTTAKDAAAAPSGAPLQDAAAYASRGAAEAARGENAAALADLDRACAMAPTVAGSFTLRGVVHLALGQADAALKDLDEALRLDPADVDARLDRAGVLAAGGRDADALSDLADLDGRLPPQAPERRDMGGLYEQLDQPAKALVEWNDWIAAHRDEVDLDRVLHSRCRARTLLGTELREAQDDCDRAIAARPDEGAYYDSRGWLELRESRPQAARADFEHSLKLHPGEAWSLYGRGLARQQLGEDAAAQADLAAARKADPKVEARILALRLAAAPAAR